MTHKTKECLERPRKLQAKYTNEDLARDDVVEDIKFDDWAHKRDAYKGYSADDYAEVIAHHEKMNAARQEALRKELAEEKCDAAVSCASTVHTCAAAYCTVVTSTLEIVLCTIFHDMLRPAGQRCLHQVRTSLQSLLITYACRYKENGKTSDDEAAEAVVGDTAAAAADEDKLGDEEQKEFTKVDKRVRTTGGGATGSVRNLRIREDTAKYLLNLDPKSAHYDPKSRSMRADPNPDKAPHEKTFAGDNALRTTGDEFDFWQRVTEHTVMEGEKGSAAHLQVWHTWCAIHTSAECSHGTSSADTGDVSHAVGTAAHCAWVHNRVSCTSCQPSCRIMYSGCAGSADTSCHGA